LRPPDFIRTSSLLHILTVMHHSILFLTSGMDAEYQVIYVVSWSSYPIQAHRPDEGETLGETTSEQNTPLTGKDELSDLSMSIL